MAPEFKEPVRTGQPLYSESQMDDFFDAFQSTKLRQTSLMNYFQHYVIASDIPANSSLIEFCCGSGLLIPFLSQINAISRYVGIDISAKNLEMACVRVAASNSPNLSFSAELRLGDVTNASQLVREQFDVGVYTSSLEHMDRNAGIRSLREMAKLLRPGGTLFLSTPITSGIRNQYKVHIYEWELQELESALSEEGFNILQMIGLLPPAIFELSVEIARKYGDGASRLLQEISRVVPESFWAPIIASALPKIAREVLIVCRK